MAHSATYSRSQQIQAAKTLTSRWKDDPVRFAREGLKIRVLAPDQIRLLETVAENRQTACKSGQKTGKTTGLAILAIWWPLTRYRGYCLLTAPTFPQVKDPLWKEVWRIAEEARKAGVELGGHLYAEPGSGWVWPGDRKTFARVTDRPERMQGISSPNLLVIVDEASGYSPIIWDPLLGNLMSGGKLVATSNPTEPSGPFFDAFTSKAEFWKQLTFRSDETPNYRERRVVIPGLASFEEVEKRRLEWGESSAAFQMRVRGEFPTQGDNAVIPVGLVNEAERRYEATEASGGLSIGVDVARFGDDETVICLRRGLKIIAWRILQGFDNVDVAGEVLKVAREHGGFAPREPKPRIKIDTIGNGSGVYDVLVRDDTIEAVGVNVAERATADGYHRLRDQLWFAIKTWLDEGGSFATDPKLLSELVAPTYGFDTQGRAEVESKDEIKLRIKRSPDRADALALAIYDVPPRDYEIGAYGVSRRF